MTGRESNRSDGPALTSGSLFTGWVVNPYQAAVGLTWCLARLGHLADTSPTEQVDRLPDGPDSAAVA